MAAPGPGGVGAGQLQHVVGHVDAVGEPRRADPPGRQQHVDAAARAQVQHPLALVQLRDRDRVVAAQAGQDRFLGQPVGLALAVEPFAEAADRLRRRVAARVSGRAATARSGHASLRLQDRAGRGSVPGPDLFPQIGARLIGHPDRPSDIDVCLSTIMPQR